MVILKDLRVEAIKPAVGTSCGMTSIDGRSSASTRTILATHELRFGEFEVSLCALW